MNSISRVVFAVLALSCLSSAQVKMFKATLDPSTHDIFAFFDGTTPPEALQKTSWLILLGGASQRVSVVDVVSGDSSVELMFSIDEKSLLAKTNNIIVVYQSKQTYVIDQKQDTASKPIFSAAKDKKTAEVYMKLGYSPAIGSPQQYTIDTAFALLLPLSSTHNYGHLGGLATVNTDNRKTVDPDSFRAFLAYQRALAAPAESASRGVLFTWLVGGGEFEKKADNMNFISSPMLEFPLRLFPRNYRNSKQPIASLDPLIGAEVGYNFRNAVTPDGLGGLFRGLAGATFMFHFNPKFPGFQGVQLSSIYRMRLPARAEVFTNTTTNPQGKVVDAPSLSIKPRHYVKTELSFGLAKSLAFSIAHEHGELPPAFRAIDNKVTIGLTYSLAVNRGVSDSLRDK